MRAVIGEAFNLRESERAALAEQLVTEGSVREAALYRIVALATRMFKMPSAAVAIIGKDRMWLETSLGLETRSSPRHESIGAHVVAADEVLIIPDACLDPKFSDFPSVREKGLRFYAGAPMRSAEGLRVGAFCLVDKKPRAPLTSLERQLLEDFAEIAMSEIESRRARRLNGILHGIAQSVGAALICTDARGIIAYVNPAAEKLLGYAANELIGREVDVIVPQRFVAAHRAGMARVVAQGRSKLAGKPIEVVVRHKGGHELPVDLGLSLFRDESGLRVNATMRDITARKQREESLSKLAFYDPLTGLARAAGFKRSLGACLDAGAVATVLMIDVDGLQTVNDGLGHVIGDALIKRISMRLIRWAPHGVKLARWSGRVFTAMLPQRDPIRARECAGDIEMALTEPFDIDGHTIVIGATIGVAMAPDHATTADDLAAAAELALERARRDGHRFRMFERAMQTESAARRTLRDEVRHGLGANELVLFFQPQISLGSGALVGAEALMRWRHPQRGLLSPAAFIPAIDDSALALNVGWWSLDQACRQIAAWRAEGRPRLRVSVNLFAAQLRWGGLKAVVADLIRTYGIAPEELELEVRETIANQDDDTVIAVLCDLRDLGVRIALDDFGTGYASLSTLKRLPVSTIKIDRGFVCGLAGRGDGHDERRDRAITAAILGVGRDLGLDVIAEGIETPAQADVLRAMRCPTGQGYLFSRPVEARDLFELPAAGSLPPAVSSAAGRTRRAN